MTNLRLANRTLTPNKALRSAILEWQQHRRWLIHWMHRPAGNSVNRVLYWVCFRSMQIGVRKRGHFWCPRSMARLAIWNQLNTTDTTLTILSYYQI
jgi:hypothetical protein